MQPLPIDAILADLGEALAGGANCVIEAPPGAGKTTRVPLALLDADWLDGGRIIMLEPRRLAAKAAAQQMARLLGQRPGETVGYRTRFDSRTGPATRIEVVTEGILTRRLQSGPSLDGVGAVIFDEFHERSLQADLGLVLAREVQQALRPDLRLLVMSATLDIAPVRRALGDVSELAAEGRSFDVELRYLPQPGTARIADATAAAVRRALADTDGDMLVFLPGAGEIRAVAAALDGHIGAIDLLPLYGDLPAAQQQRVLAPSPDGRRRVVLATSIAETSLTIPGIRIVVDSGYSRLPAFDPVSGMTRLTTVKVSQAAAAQRAGRAGRLEHGVCYRLWSAEQHERLAPQHPPEIASADLAPLRLELAAWGAEPDALAWPEPPPAAALAQAGDLLRRIGALDAGGRITAHGRELAALPLHPRLAHMIVQGRALGCGALACRIAALLGERDPLRSSEAGADIGDRLALLARADKGGRGVAGRIEQAAAQLRRLTGVADAAAADDRHLAGVLLAQAWPDRIGQRRGSERGRFVLANGRGATLDPADRLAGCRYIAAALLDGKRSESRIFLAAELDERAIRDHLGDYLETVEVTGFDPKTESVVARRELRLGRLVIESVETDALDDDARIRALCEGIRSGGPDVLPWTPQLRQWQARVALLRRVFGDDWPDVGDDHLLATLPDWLGPYLAGISRLADLDRVDLAGALAALLPYERRRLLDELAPAQWVSPAGGRCPIDYTAGEVPVLSVPLQQVLGQLDTPRVAGGAVGLLLHLLSPARRPLAVTDDLGRFWQVGYPDVRRDMRGRYPKHDWPEDPLAAPPQRGAKRSRR